MQLDFIKIDIRVSDDKMSARFALSPVGGSTGELTAAHLDSALSEAGVTYGIAKQSLVGIAADWNAKPREVVTATVAAGSPPRPQNDGSLRVAVKHLSAPADVKAVLGRKYYWEIASLSQKFQRVDHGTVIARRDTDIQWDVGHNVYGEKIEYEDVNVEGHGAGIVEKNNMFIAGNTYTASVTGIVFADGFGDLHVMPLNFDGTVEVKVMSSMMTAELIAEPPGPGGVMPSGEYVRNLIKSSRIVYGVDEELLEKTLARYAQGDIVSREVIVIASGTPAVKGDDGHVEFCFNTETAPTPVINEDGSADYKNIDIVTSVKSGAPLARLLPPTKGTPGKDLLGRVLPALDGAPAMLPLGANTIISKDDPSVLVALTDGIVRYDGTVVNVSHGYVVSDHVDYSTGNIKYEHTISVGGDVKSGFDIDCGTDLQVNGSIEDCKIKAGGSVLCRCGFVGTGRGVIEASGDVSLGYAKNQTIIARGDVNIAKEALNCDITSRKSIRVYGHNLSVAGGTLSAAEAIVVKTVGNNSGIKTTLQITVSPQLADELAVIESNIAKNAIDAQKLTQTLKTLPPAKRLDKALVDRLNAGIQAIKQNIASLEKRAGVIKSTVNAFDGAFIRIDRCAYPGTTLKFGDCSLNVKEILAGGKTVKMVEGEIKVI